MKRRSLSAMFVVALLLVTAGSGNSADPKLPLIGGKPALALVNGEPVTLEEFDRALATVHEGATDNAAAPRAKGSELLERLISAKLVLQEARNIGLDTLPEVTAAVKAYEEDTLRSILYGVHVQGIKRGDPKDVEKRYRAAVKEVKVKSVFFDKEEVGRRLEEEVKSGAAFDAAAGKMLAAGEAKGSLDGRYMRWNSLSPEVAAALSSMKKGGVSPLIRVGKGFTMLKLEAIRFPEDPAAREKAEKEALQAKKVDALRAYVEQLKKKYVTVNRKLFDSLDYDAPKPGLEKMLADERVVAEVKGEKPVTVGELTDALQRKFFHGAARAAQGGKLNKRKKQILDEILGKRVTLKEGRAKKLDRTDQFKARVEEYRDSILFGVFIRKAIDPDITVDDAEIKAYIADHIEDYTTPEMIRIDGLAFSAREDAENAVDRLRRGADFQWMRANAGGQVDATNAEDLLQFDGAVVVISTLPEGVRKAVSGTKEGDYRVYSDAGGRHYVLLVRETLPPRPQPFEEVAEDVRRKVYSEKRQRAFRDWEGKLRAASEVKVFATGDRLDRLVQPHGR